MDVRQTLKNMPNASSRFGWALVQQHQMMRTGNTAATAPPLPEDTESGHGQQAAGPEGGAAAPADVPTFGAPHAAFPAYPDAGQHAYYSGPAFPQSYDASAPLDMRSAQYGAPDPSGHGAPPPSMASTVPAASMLQPRRRPPSPPPGYPQGQVHTNPTFHYRQDP